MGRQAVNQDNDVVQLRAFTRHLLHDLQALETMLAEDMIESHRGGQLGWRWKSLPT